MKKRILVNKVLNENLVETALKFTDKDYDARARKRVTDLRRAAQLATEAAEEAERSGKEDLAKKLRAKVDEIEDLIRNFNIDSIEDDNPEEDSEQTEKDKKDSGEEDSEDEDKEGSDEEDQDDDSEIDDIDSTDNKKDKNKTTTQTDGPEKEDDDIPDEGDFDPRDDIEVEPTEPTEDEKDPTKEDEKEDESEDETEEGGDGFPEKDKKDNSDEEEDTEIDNKDKKDTDSSDSDDKEEPGEEGYPAPPEKDDKDSSDKDDSKDNTEEPGEEGYPAPEEKDNKDSEDDSDKENNDNSDTEDDKKTDSKNKDSEEENTEEDESEDDDEKSKSKKNSLSYNDDDEDEGSEDDDDPIKDPFADNEDIPDLKDLFKQQGGDKTPRDATLKEIIELLQSLSGEAREGAIKALEDMLSSGMFNESLSSKVLTEAKSVREMTDDEFGDYINGVYDLIDEIKEIEYIDPKEVIDKKTKVNQWVNDPKAVKELQDEEKFQYEKEYNKKVAREKVKSTFANVGTLEKFKLDFYSAINNQVEMIRQEYQTYDEINAEYESEDVIMRADVVKELPNEAIPIIDVYFDVSGSWEQEDIEIGKRAINSIKAFEDSGEIKLNIFFFSDWVSSEYAEVKDRGTHGWRDILSNISATGAKNVVIMTDDDIDTIVPPRCDAKHGPTLRVDGCVWFLWKNGLSSPWCTKRLIGSQGNYQYAFYR